MNQIGHNKPPSALEAEQPAVTAVLEDADATLTGVVVENAAQDKAVEDLLGRLKAAKKAVTAAHKSDKEPWLEGSRRVDAQKIDLVAPLDTAIKTAQDCRTPWLNKIEAERKAAAQKAQEVAEAAQRKLQEAHAAKRAADLDDARAIEDAERAAKDAKIKFAGAKKSKPTGMKTIRQVAVDDIEDAVIHYLEDARLTAAVLAMAKSDVHSGLRSIPGISITDERVAR